MLLEIEANRAVRKWTLQEQAKRVAWAVALPLFRFSPRILWGWRVWILRRFGATIGSNVHVHPSVQIALPWNLTMGPHSSAGDQARLYNLGPISIGSGATVSQGAHLCAGTHNHRRADMPLVKSPITVGEGAWVCADAFVGPGVTIGEYAVVGARAVAMRDVPGWAIVAGNPARVIGKRPPLEPR